MKSTYNSSPKAVTLNFLGLCSLGNELSHHESPWTHFTYNCPPLKSNLQASKQKSSSTLHPPPILNILQLNQVVESIYLSIFICFSAGKESACNAGDPGWIPGSGRSPGEGNGNPLQHPCLGNPTDRGARWAKVHGLARVGHDLMTKPLTTTVCWSISMTLYLSCLCVCVCVCVCIYEWLPWWLRQ